MSLQNQIKDQAKKAMLARETTRLNTLRGLLAAFTSETMAKKRKPSEELADDEAIEVVRRSVKQRKDSIEQFTAGGRMDLVESEQAEMTILQSYLPQMMNRDQIRKIVEAKKVELGVTDRGSAGKLMGAVMKELKGKADGDDVKSVTEELLA